MFNYRSIFAVLPALLLHPAVAAQVHAAQDPAVVNRLGTAVDGVAVRPTPDWVRDRAVPEVTQSRIGITEGGVIYLLSDAQYRTRADGHDDWFRAATKITDRSGLEATGQIELSYNPAFETIEINFIHLIRAGKIIDLTQETRFKVVEREEELNDGIINGTLKAIANLRDVRVGDIVDYATTTQSATRLWPNQAFYQFTQRYSDPVALKALRLVWPTGMAPQMKAINSDIVFTKSQQAGSTVWEWQAQDPPAHRGEDNVPASAFQWGRVDISTMASWAELARWTAALYRGDETLGADFVARLDAIAKASTVPADRLTEVVRYVQDNIRYVGEELGEGSYVPRSPKTVLARGYGDCKDKSLLLAVALRRLGIDAVPALVSTRAGERLPDRLPSPLLFDHVIVRAVLDGKVMWIDATGAHQGGRGGAIVQSDLGYALPIRSEQTTLEPMRGFADRAGRYTVLEQFAVDESADQPLILHVETRYTDARADTMRANWAASSTGKIADENLEFYHRRFAGLVASKPLELHDDRDGNVLTMIENYTMPRAAFATAKLSSSLITRAYAVQNVLPDRQPNPRVEPLALPDHLVSEQTIELRVRNRDIGTIDDLDSRRGPVSFTRQATRLPDGLRMTYRLDTGASDAVPAAETEPVYAVSDQIKDEAGIDFHIDKAPKTDSSPEGIDPLSWTPVKPLVEKAVVLMQKEDDASRLSALSYLADAATKVPHPSAAAGLIDGLKGAILAELHRQQAALASLQSATTQYAGNPPVYRLWIGYEIEFGNGESIARAMVRTRAVQPAVLTALDKDWVRAALGKVQSLAPERRETARQGICTALADSNWQQEPRTAMGNVLLGCAITAHSERSELTEARAGLARSPSTQTLVTLATDRRHQALWPEIERTAGIDFRKSLQREVDRTTAAATSAPGNYEAVTNQMKALRAMGRFQQALAAGKSLASETAQIEVVGSEAFWLFNEYATNLRALGKLDEAIAVMQPVLALGSDRYPELTSLAINRDEMLMAAGRYREADEALADLDAHRLDQLSPYGRMWVWANHACVLRALGRDADAQQADLKLAAKPSDNWSAATVAAACRHDPKTIADMLVTRLRSEDSRPDALGLFIEFGTAEARTPLEMAMRATLATARQMPEVRVAFAKYGRPIHYAGTTEGFPEF